MPEVDLVTLADAGAFVSHEHQAHLADVLRLRLRRVDTATATVVLEGPDGAEHPVRAHLIGSSSPDDGTWLWAWENVNDFPQAFVRQSERVRGLGERYGVRELTTATLPLTDGLPESLLHAVKTVTGVTVHGTAATGRGGTLAWLLLDDPSLALPAPTVARAVGVVTSALAAGGVVDHRRALSAWTEQRGVGLAHVADDVVELTLTDGSLQVRFDDAGRIAGLGRRLRSIPAPAAPTGPAPVVEPDAGGAPDPDLQPLRDVEPVAPEPVAPQPIPAPSPAAPAPTGAPRSAPAPRRKGLLERLFPSR